MHFSNEQKVDDKYLFLDILTECTPCIQIANLDNFK